MMKCLSAASAPLKDCRFIISTMLSYKMHDSQISNTDIKVIALHVVPDTGTGPIMFFFNLLRLLGKLKNLIYVRTESELVLGNLYSQKFKNLSSLSALWCLWPRG